jgi:S-adenosylmethionine:tRNA ribosyltransferase-isomerase
MLTSDFDYRLPVEHIAQEPLPRGESRLLHLDREGGIHHHRIRDLPALLSPADLIVINNTEVLPARLEGHRSAGGRVELLLVAKRSATEWLCLAKPGRKARPGTEIVFGESLVARVVSKEERGLFLVRFSEPVEIHLATLGRVPLPPYIKRPDREEDRRRYQTIYASEQGAIAAPTAGLHFDEALLEALRDRKIQIAELTLHVGIGTFKPVSSVLVHDHRMDPEQYRLGEETAAAVNSAGKRDSRIVAVGTTVVRALETVAAKGQGQVRADQGQTDLFIAPGYRFLTTDLLLTNFHLPRSTLLMLVCAFSGRERVLAAYEEAIREGYRFYSYGDAMLAERPLR